MLAGVAGVAMAAAPAGAQSFFQQLFGGGAPSYRPAPPQPSIRPANLHGSFFRGDYRRYRRDPEPWRRNSRDDRDDDDRRDRDMSGKVRTLCVRLCDGFYFPVSESTSKRNLVRDQRKCQASCGEDAMLFYEKAPGGGDAASMVDVGGRPYSGLPNAFLYRQTKVAGCSCKPSPWSLAERARHLGYAAAEQEKKAELLAKAEAEKAAREGRQPAAGSGAQVATAGGQTPQPGESGDPPAPDHSTTPDGDIASVTASKEATPAPSAALPPFESSLEPRRRTVSFSTEPHSSESRERKQKSAARTAAAERRPSRVAPKVASSPSPWFGGQAKFTYPGDAPARYR